MHRKIKSLIGSCLITLALLLAGCTTSFQEQPEQDMGITETSPGISGTEDTAPGDTADAGGTTLPVTEGIPEYSGEPYAVLNGNVPDFTEDEFVADSFEQYSDLDALGRCGTAMACIGQDLMPTGERESISEVKPSGWQSAEYGNVDGGWLYNRCHLIGYQLTGENANERNLITGTRYMNVEGMLPFEDMVADYIRETGNHVLYRVTPVFEGENLVASGVQMEAMSVEDSGDGVQYNVYCYNVQPGIGIDYADGDSWETGSGQTDGEAQDPASTQSGQETYILNTNTMKFHEPDCPSVDDMEENNKQEYTGDRADLIADGYGPCGRCDP